MKPAKIRASKIMVTDWDKLTKKRTTTTTDGMVVELTIVDLPLFGSKHPKKKVKK